MGWLDGITDSKDMNLSKLQGGEGLAVYGKGAGDVGQALLLGEIGRAHV